MCLEYKPKLSGKSFRVLAKLASFDCLSPFTFTIFRLQMCFSQKLRFRTEIISSELLVTGHLRELNQTE